MRAIEHANGKNELRTANPPDAAAVEALRNTLHGRDGEGRDITIGAMLDEGHAVPMDTHWIFDDQLLIDEGDGLKKVPATELEITSGVDETGANAVRWFEARKGGKLVKRSINPILKGIEVQAPPQATMAIQTSRGIMLSDDLMRRDPQPGRVEYWFALPDGERTEAEHAALVAEHPSKYEFRTTPEGAKQQLELVHASAIAAQQRK